MSYIVVTLFLCGPAGCVERTSEFRQFRSCEFAQQVIDRAVSQAGEGSRGRCEEVEA